MKNKTIINDLLALLVIAIIMTIFIIIGILVMGAIGHFIMKLCGIVFILIGVIGGSYVLILGIKNLFNADKN